MNEFVETVVIGAGPIGIETAIEFQHRGIETRVFDAGPVGHTISWWAPQTRWFSSNDRIAIAGVPLHTIDQAKASREEYLNYLRTVVDQFQVPISTFHRVVSITPIESNQNGHAAASESLRRWRLGFSRSRGQNAAKQTPDYFLDANAVVLAIGGTDFPNRLGVPGEDLPHVDGYLREVHRYHGRRVLIIGGRNSAVEAAIRLHRGGAKVSLCYHREQLPEDGIKYWLRPEIEGLIRSGSVQSFFQSRVTEITEQTVTLETGGPDQKPQTHSLPFDDVLALIGYQQDSSLFRQLEIVSELPSGAPLYDPETMQTPREGIYVAGTAVGGTQSSKYQIFLENCHDHPAKIADHLCGERSSPADSKGATHQSHGNPERGNSARGDQGLRQRIELQPES
ncbi:NAD(P)-binding domain-containing protein [Aporhodopirellula aestuarii]|uniref:NAD(P)-binding domain-containing protein n=1 Tax=Aporhodopirellula aestuarii TaxID=2950107 RepID=A0ABT0U0H7_9BACT|nr:NAD(P)-binding domain-containing protein [Aporhodopirellula aestuarii]MCM2370369.1 NAD(P)-binding domain-containing protein [Aporhodopirellula aestuarii]